uniref:Transcriptional regulator n=1 Tax=Heligmosomoides polygyrus TaxID=6339 RepID=A0A183FB22_HELPZ
LIDEFVEICFSREPQCREAIQFVAQIRKELNIGLQKKLHGVDYNSKELTTSINRLIYILTENSVEIS